jgi:hypothetical protein
MARDGRYRWVVFLLPVAKSSVVSDPVFRAGEHQQGKPFGGARQRGGSGFGLALTILAMTLAGCSSKATETLSAPSSTASPSSPSSAVAQSGADTSGAVTPADTGAVVPATPADETIPTNESSAASEGAAGPAPAAANQITGSDLVAVTFDFPDTARPIKEVDQPVVDGTKRLALKVSGLTYHGVVCGFSIKGTRPESPVLIRMTGTKADGSAFDSGPISVAWTSAEPPEVSSGGADNNGWNFLSDANPNRSGPGWVVSLGGVTPDGAGSIPKTAACSLEPGVGTFSAVNGPIGYWAGFARN